MGFFKSKKDYGIRTERDNMFLKDFAIKLNGLMRYTEGHDQVTAALKKLQEDFQYTTATQVKGAKKLEKKIEKKYDELKGLLQKLEWDEVAVFAAIRNIGMKLEEINAMRSKD